MYHTHSFPRSALTATALAALSILSACQSSPTPRVIDNPMDRDKVDVKVGQTLIVKLTDMDGPKTDWIVTSSAASALTGPTHKAVPAANGALNLDVYEYVGAAPGQQELTFSYRQPDQQPTTDDTMRVMVTVH